MELLGAIEQFEKLTTEAGDSVEEYEAGEEQKRVGEVRIRGTALMAPLSLPGYDSAGPYLGLKLGVGAWLLCWRLAAIAASSDGVKMGVVSNLQNH